MQQTTIYYKLLSIISRKFTWFALGVIMLVFTAFRTRPENNVKGSISADIPVAVQASENHTDLLVEESIKKVKPEGFDVPTKSSTEIKINRPVTSGKDLVAYALSLQGTPYRFGGKSAKGFDCSGFVYHVFQEYDYDIERSSRAQATQGVEVNTDEVKPGDLLFFTGTNPKVRTVGHVGIVITQPGEPVEFVHSSSNGGVKISELEGYYTTRFMMAKRM